MKSWTIQSILAETGTFLAGRGFSSPRLEAEALLAYVLHEPRVYLFTHFDRPLTAAEIDGYRTVLRRRLTQEPLAYITGGKEFMSLHFAVSPQVLIPRPETELMVEEALRLIKKFSWTRVCDMGTGCGAVAISLVCYANRELRVTAVDISAGALAVAGENGALHQVRIDWRQSDLFAALGEDEIFSLITANLPYVTRAEYADLPASVRDCEPRQALVGGEDGLEVYRRLLREALRHLTADGVILLEISPSQASRVPALAGTDYAYRLLKDLSGRDRLVELWRKTAGDAAFLS
jgi:release factor glutamine methyltransferase